MRETRVFATLSIMTAVLITGSTHRARAGIVSETSSNPLVATVPATPDYSGSNFTFVPYPSVFSAAAITDTLRGLGTSTLTFDYVGYDFTNPGYSPPSGIRPVLNLVNDTGDTINELTFTLTGSAGSVFFPLVGIGSVSVSPSGATFTGTYTVPSTGLTSMTLPLSLAPGGVEAVYLPVELTSGSSGSFSLTQSVPEPSSLVMAVIGLSLLGGFGLIRRRRGCGSPER